MPRFDSKQTLQEHICTVPLPRELATRFLQESAQQLPAQIHPELRVITADVPTRNRTLYPKESLRGSAKQGTGLISFISPYPVPLIRDHRTGAGTFGCEEASPVYGRVWKAPEFVENVNEGYVRAVPVVTHPEAVEGILTQAWLTVSLGSRTESVQCTVCGQELTEDYCDHEKGKFYTVEKQKVQAFWRVGPIKAQEISFVVTPADVYAGVLTPNLAESSKQGRLVGWGPAEAKRGAGALSRLLVPKGDQVYDLLTGKRVTESCPHLLPPPAKVGFLFHGWGG